MAGCEGLARTSRSVESRGGDELPWCREVNHEGLCSDLAGRLQQVGYGQRRSSNRVWMARQAICVGEACWQLERREVEDAGQAELGERGVVRRGVQPECHVSDSVNACCCFLNGEFRRMNLATSETAHHPSITHSRAVAWLGGPACTETARCPSTPSLSTTATVPSNRPARHDAGISTRSSWTPMSNSTAILLVCSGAPGSA